jgi:hypothetical protein
MNPSNIAGSDNIEKDDNLDSEIERWFDDALSSLRSIAIPFLWTRIMDQLMGVGYPYDRYINAIKSNNRSDNEKEIPYLFDEMTIQVLIKTLSKQSPKVIAKLETNRSRMPEIIAEQLRHSKYIQYCLRTQQKCNHVYKVPLNKMLYENSGKKILHCRRCHGTKYHPSLFPKK